MNKPLTSIDKLQRMADAFEALMLSASDAEVLALQGTRDARKLSEEVRALIGQRLEEQGIPSTERKTTERADGTRSIQPELVEFIRGLALAHRGIARPLQASLSAGRPSKKEDLDAIVMDLLANAGTGKSRRGSES